MSAVTPGPNCPQRKDDEPAATDSEQCSAEDVPAYLAEIGPIMSRMKPVPEIKKLTKRDYTQYYNRYALNPYSPSRTHQPPDHASGVDAPTHEGNAMMPHTPAHASRPGDFPPASAKVPVRVLSIPLEDGKTFDVRFPMDLTKDEYDFVLQNIKFWERTIVARPRA